MSTLLVLPDFREEDWPSMDLAAEKLVEYLQLNDSPSLNVHSHTPVFSKIATALPFQYRQASRFNFDRLLNRLIVYPRQVRCLSSRYDLFHVADHTYSALVHSLPAQRTGVYCHDLDAFRCLIDPRAEPRPWWFRKMAERILSGMQKAAVVFHSTLPVRDAILKHRLVDQEKLVHAPYGVSEEFSPNADASPSASMPETAAKERSKYTSRLEWLPNAQGQPWIAHVGSCIPRKRIDVLLDVFARLRESIPELQLVKIGGDFSRDHEQQIESLNLRSAIVHRKGLERSELAEVYRSANAVLITSDAEGFGLPVIEAMACGAMVVASDIPVLRETGGTGAVFARVGDIDDWVGRIHEVVANSPELPSLSTRLEWAARFSWTEHARIIANAYAKLL